MNIAPPQVVVSIEERSNCLQSTEVCDLDTRLKCYVAGMLVGNK